VTYELSNADNLALSEHSTTIGCSPQPLQALKQSIGGYMTLQEKELLTRFLQQLASAQAGQKDAEAETLIREGVARQPDAAYLLVQRALQLEQLLQASQEQLNKIQGELEQTRAGSAPSGRFLGGDPNAWGRASAQQAPAQQPAPQAQQQPLAQQPLQAQPGAPSGATARAAPGGSWGSGLFGNIASTAAGVVAGSFLFQGIQGLMHRGESHPLAGGALPTENTLEGARHDEPQLLNSYSSTPDSESDSSSFADAGDSGDSGDFA
jgi:uncharacterized protein